MSNPTRHICPHPSFRVFERCAKHDDAMRLIYERLPDTQDRLYLFEHPPTQWHIVCENLVDAMAAYTDHQQKMPGTGIHRGVYQLSQLATSLYGGAHETEYDGRALEQRYLDARHILPDVYAAYQRLKDGTHHVNAANAYFDAERRLEHWSIGEVFFLESLIDERLFVTATLSDVLTYLEQETNDGESSPDDITRQFSVSRMRYLKDDHDRHLLDVTTVEPATKTSFVVTFPD